MSRSRKTTRKRSKGQLQQLKNVQNRGQPKEPLLESTNGPPRRVSKAEQIKKMEEELAQARRELAEQEEKSKKRIEEMKKKVDESNKRFWNEQRKNARWRERAEAHKVDLAKAKAEAARLYGVVHMLEKKLWEDARDTKDVISKLQAEICQLRDLGKGLNHQRMMLWKQIRRLEGARPTLKKRKVEKLKERPETFRMMKKGMYTPEVRKLARVMVQAGATEARIGEALQEIAEAMGIKMPKKISKRSIGHFVLELDIAADLQTVYEILKSSNLTYSSDSTSHKHIEYKCRTIAMKVVNYSNPDSPPEWKLRTLGIGTSVNHTSEVQVDGLRKHLEVLADVFNRSPLAKRENLRFVPNDFVCRLLGTTGDHAADQKKSHELLRIWRLEAILQRLGEEALFEMDGSRVLAVLMALKMKQVEECGGQEAWEALPAEEKAALDILIIREVGQQVFDKLPEDEQVKLTRFIRTGCCMHKDLNCVKAGDKALAAMWQALKLDAPVLLANKANASTLEDADLSNLTAAEKRALEGSKRGGSHATVLAGLICRNKDKKKGQQDTYDYFMEKQTGHRVPFPDVSNTRYGSHGEAAATLITHLETFRKFVPFIANRKDRPGLTNIEKNFEASLKDIPTLTELAVLALYCIAVSRPFMGHVRAHTNILQLQAYFEKKTAFLQSIIDDPTIWTGNNVSHETGCLGTQKWDAESLTVLAAVKALAPSLPHLNDAVVAFVRGAREAFVERFSDEFKDGSGIDQLTESERREFFFASTNCVNEGGLGSWRRGQTLRPAETMDKFNAGYKTTHNDTQSFSDAKLTKEEDQLFMMREARNRDKSGFVVVRKMAQIAEDERKGEENRKKQEKNKERRDERETALKETAEHLVLEFDKINELRKEELNRQLDYHRDAEKGLPMDTSDRIPAKSNIKINPDRKAWLIKAVTRYNARRGVAPESAVVVADNDVQMSDPTEDAFYLSDHDDDLA